MPPVPLDNARCVAYNTERCRCEGKGELTDRVAWSDDRTERCRREFALYDQGRNRDDIAHGKPGQRAAGVERLRSLRESEH